MIKDLNKTNNKKFICAFLEGCYDSEGSVDKNRLRVRFMGMNKNYVEMVSLALNKLNIKHSLNKDKRNLNWVRIYSQECFKFHKLIHFSIKYKGENLKMNILSYNQQKQYNKRKRVETLCLKEKEWCKKYDLTRNQYYRHKTYQLSL